MIPNCVLEETCMVFIIRCNAANASKEDRKVFIISFSFSSFVYFHNWKTKRLNRHQRQS